MRVFGVANHSPEAVIRILLKAKLAKSVNIAVLPVGFVLSKSSNHTFLFFLTVTDFLRNYENLKNPKYEQCSCIVFANPMKLNELRGIQALDFEPNPAYKGFGFILKTLDVQKIRTFKGSDAVERKTGKYLSRLVEHVQQGSLLNKFMTFIYTLPSSKQTPVKGTVLNWLYLGKPDSALAKALEGLEQCSITAKVQKRLQDILFSDVGRAFQAAFKEYRALKKSGSVNLSKLAKTYAVSDYELRYILSVIENLKHAGLYVDSFDKARNRKRA